jgi:2-keto-4-pentenoate hydratase
MNEKEKIDAAVSQILAARERGAPCAPLREIIGENDVHLAYAVQEKVAQHWASKGAQRVGAKIGLTSEAVQKQLGVDQPDFGELFDFMAVKPGATIPWNELMQPKAEVEVAFVMGADLVAPVPTEAELKKCIAHLCVAIEVVGSRVADWNIKISDTIADNASSSHFVIGSKKVALEGFDLEECAMTLHSNDELKSSGLGKDCLGSPLNALLWLAIKMAHLGRPLKKGDIILSGALGPMVAVSQGDQLVADIAGLGKVELNFGD